MSSITFDWSQIAYIGSPLIVPWWAIVNVFIGFVALYWVFSPAMYYSNVSGRLCRLAPALNRAS